MTDLELLNEIRKILDQNPVPDNDDAFRIMLIEILIKRHKDWISLEEVIKLLDDMRYEFSARLDRLKDRFRNINEFHLSMPSFRRAADERPKIKDIDLDVSWNDPAFPSFSTRAYNRLKYNLDVKTLRDLVALSRSQILNARGVGRKTIDEITQVLSEYGLRIND